METIVIKQEKRKNGIIAVIPVLGYAIHALIRCAYGMPLLDCLIILLVLAVCAVVMAFIIDHMFVQTLLIDSDKFRLKIGAISRTVYYTDIDRCIYRNYTYLKVKLKNGKSKELYLGQFDNDGCAQLISSIKSKGIEIVDLMI